MDDDFSETLKRLYDYLDYLDRKVVELRDEELGTIARGIRVYTDCVAEMVDYDTEDWSDA